MTQCSRLLDEILNRKPNKHLPYVGAAAFSHKGGLHVSAVQKDPKTYEHIRPEAVGNVRNIVVSDQAGKSNIISRLKSIGINFKEDDPKIKKLLEEVKEHSVYLEEYSRSMIGQEELHVLEVEKMLKEN